MRAFWLSSATRVSASSIVDATIDHGLDAGLRLTARIRRKLLAVAKRVNPTQEPTRYLAEVRRTLQRYEPELAITLSDAALLAWLRGGRSVASFLPEVEPAPSLRGLAPPGGPPWARRTATGEPWDDHELVLVKEAAKDLARRRVMTAADYAQAEREIRQKAFTVARLDSENAVAKVRDAVTDAVTQGTTLREFRNRLAEDMETSSLGPGHVETVFRTNVGQSYARGQKKIVGHILVQSALPYVSYNAIHDSRCRPDHAAMEKHGIQGSNVYRTDDPVIRKFWAPWAWNCRCSMILMTLEMAAAKGIREAQRWLESGMPPARPAFVDHPDFDLPPGWAA